MKAFIFIICLFFCFNISAQDDNKGLEFHSISISLNGYLAEGFDSDLQDKNSGFGLNFDIAVNKGPHIFKLYAGGGSEVNLDLWGESENDKFKEYNLMYGRELNIKEWFGIDLFAGVGFFRYIYERSSQTKSKKGVFGFPLQSKIRFNTGRIFSLGLQLHSNINSATTIFQSGIFVQWKL